MKQMLSDMTVAQFVERFMAMALDQDDARLDGAMQNTIGYTIK